jgi:hypothetical protein
VLFAITVVVAAAAANDKEGMDDSFRSSLHNFFNELLQQRTTFFICQSYTEKVHLVVIYHIK